MIGVCNKCGTYGYLSKLLIKHESRGLMSISSPLAMHREIPHGIPPSPLDVASIMRIKHNALYSFVGKESPRQVSIWALLLSSMILL